MVLLQEVELGRDALLGLQKLEHGRLTLGVLSSFGTFSLPPILADFSAAHPGIKINVLRLGSREIEKRLLDGELDLAVANTPASANQIVVEPLVADSLALLVGDQHILAGHHSLKLADLSEHGLILLAPSYSTRQIIDATFATNNVMPRIVMEMNAIEPILSTVRLSTLGTILSATLASHWPGLHVVKIIPTAPRTVAFFKRRDSYLSPAAEALSEAIRQHFQCRAQ
jgi:LysR family cyn operon transcriptional activator